MPRSSELTSDIAKRLAEAFQDGASIRVACGLVGIDPSTYTKWMKAGREGDQRYVAFFILMKKSRARPELEAFQAIRKAFLTDKNPDWRAAAKYLELKDPDRFKKDNHPLPSVLIDADDLLRQAEERRKSKGGE